ncbi:MAG TPA: glycoside hydrolase family 15 protein [Candidatus Binatia bacterium]|nr:glycoside hydrolase family 15 protein [Candidatus Binatia bacterium]
MPSPIEDYALLSDGRGAALVARDGSVDWLCWPRFDSGACFAALLGTPDHGRWRIAPAAAPSRVTRRCHPGTLVLETRFDTADGTVTVTDFMPHHTPGPMLVRSVAGCAGRVPMQMDLALRFDYGASVPWVTRLPDRGGIRAVAGPDLCVLRSPVPLAGRDRRTQAEFTVAAGEQISFVLAHGASHLPVPDAIDVARALERELADGHRWLERCTYRGQWREAVTGSLRTLHGLIYRPTGGVVAAATTSLPEQLGGVRNWDYRFCWLRDATLSLLALMNAGYYDEAGAWRAWLERAASGAPEQLQIMYGIAGERRLPEATLPWLPGYENAAPVRIGNAAAGQLQLDVYGEVMDALHQARKGGLASDAAGWALQRALLGHLEKIWRDDDEGLWETRGGRQPFTFSKVMCWVAFDRGIKAVEQHGLDGPLSHWRTIRETIHREVCARGFDGARNAFVQSFGAHTLDASLLLLPTLGFLPPADPRIVGTIEAVQRELTRDGFVLRYDTAESRDGLPPGEGAFLACSFWLADALALIGRRDEACALFERLLALRNDVGLLAEEYDPRAKRFTGNFPQAFSHVALVNTAMNLGREVGTSEQRGEDAPPGPAPAAPRAPGRGVSGAAG